MVFVENTNRIVFIDALRGFALMGIVLIHFVEHFDFFYPAETNFLFSAAMDQWLMDAVIYLISGKAYSIFAITFGFSFFIQIDNKEQQGIDFRWRFAWRLSILLLLGLAHSLLYRGDILHIYALLGLPLILLYKVKTKILWILFILLVMELPLLFHLVMWLLDPAYVYTPDWGGSWFEEGEAIYANGDFWDVVKINIWKSRYLVYAWTYYSGRAVQLMALFILGLIIGRKRYFQHIQDYKNQLGAILLISLFAIFTFHFLMAFVSNSALPELPKGLLSTLLKAFSNLAYTAAIMSVFILLYLPIKRAAIFESLAKYGKMSLTNYVSQAIFGVFFFFNFGLGMWKYMGTTWSLLMGCCVFAAQLLISKYWLKHYHYGPLEWLWRALTYMDFSLKMKRKDVRIVKY